MPTPSGAALVLTADRTLTARYDVLLDGMFACSQTTTTPSLLMNALLLRRAFHHDSRAQLAPLGLRRIEAALCAGGLDPADVVVVDDAHLRDAVGPRTRAVAISTGEPAGLGMSSTTMAGIAGGTIYPQEMFARLARHARRLISDRAPEARLVLGGPGAWQLADDPSARRALGIDHVVIGHAEGNAAEIFTAILDGRDLPEVIPGRPVPADAIPPIRAPTTMGVVEISRGCGLGCDFCAIARTPMEHLPPDTILADTRTNIAGGVTSIAVLSEDLFRYGGRGIHCNPDALLTLLRSLRGVDGVRLVQADHAGIASVAQYSDAELAEVRRLLVGDTASTRPWLNLGVETASGPLLEANGGRPKMGGAPAHEWADLCAQQLRRLCATGFIPMASLVVGLPGETQQDVERTLAWVRSLREQPLTVFPVLHAPIDGAPPPISQLTRLHWQLIRECYELNFKWVPRMYADSQAGAGVPGARRLLFQILARAQTVQWRARLARHARSAP